MSNIAEEVSRKIRNLMNGQGMSFAELARLTDIPKSAMHRYATGATPKIPMDRLERIASALGVTAEFLLGWEVNPETVTIPVLGRVPAGIPIEVVEDVVGYEEISGQLAKTGEFFALRVTGNSMEPKISDGDVVIVRKQETAENGEVVVALIGRQDATLKRFFKTETGIKLVPNNPAFDPLFFSPEEVNSLPVQIIGRAVELRSRM